MEPANCRVIVVGKTGSGKSTLCNQLLKRNVFPVYEGMGGQTMETQQGCITHGSTTFHVVDTPDVFTMGTSADTFVSQLRKHQPAGIPIVALLVVRLDTRFTPTDRQLCDYYMQVLSRQYRRNVAIVFTRVEGLGPISKQITLSSLQELVKKTKDRYVAAYHNMDEQQRQEIFQTVLSSLHDIPEPTMLDKIKGEMRAYRRLLLSILCSVGGVCICLYFWRDGWIATSVGTVGQITSTVQGALRWVPSNGTGSA